MPEGTEVPTVGLVAHADTNPEGKAEDGSAPNPKVITYEGGDIRLCNNDEIICVSENPHLEGLVGQDIVVTDGKSLLGGDDKAGIVEIIFALKHLVEHPEIKHPNIRVAIVPDEEIGGQVRHLTRTEGQNNDKVMVLDRDKWNVNQAYTVDGGELSEYSVETFNAVMAKVTIAGKLVHPKDGKALGLLNASTLTMHFLELLDRRLMPCERSEGREPHTTVLAINGNMAQMTIKVLLRGFEQSEIDYQKDTIDSICDALNNMFHDGKFEVEFEDSYKNMAVYLAEHPMVENLLIQAIEMQGLTLIKEAIRGGTDGSRLSELGCLCPNIFTGTMNMHAKTEHLVLEWAYQTVGVLINLMALWGVWAIQKIKAS